MEPDSALTEGCSADPSASSSALDLVSRIGAGDSSAETDLINRYAKSIRFFLQRRYRDPTLIEDVWQETFARVIVRLRSSGLDDPNALPGFVRGTALNAAREYIRKDLKFQSSIEQDRVMELPTYEPDPLERASDKLLRRMVRNVVDELGVDRDRRILLRFYYDNIEKADICRELDLDPDHFDRVLYRARQRLKQKIELKYGAAAANSAMLFAFGATT